MEAMRRAMEWAANGMLQIEPLVKYYPLSRIQDAFEDIVARKSDLIKVIIVPE
jgi:threonine dehydrogenase-like Zn-dependent dehydrogenase